MTVATCGVQCTLYRFQSIVAFDENPAVLRCRGDEDRTTQGSRRRALVRAIRAQTDVTVDLTELVFADASLMIDLAVLARRLRACGRAILVRGAQPQIMTLIELVGLDRLPGVRIEGPSRALA
jgi:anti-anti-sigma regulatory factor